MAGELRATLLTTVKGDAVKKLQKDLGGLTDSLKGISGVVGKVAKGFAGFASAIGATRFVTASIEQAKLLEQTYRSLETVFGPLTGEMQKFAEGAAKIGLSQTEAAKASIFIGGVLQQYGVSTEKAAESTQRLVSLAADLSFVYGYDVQEALLGMTALFRGEYDPIEKFGVAMKQNEIESIKAARGLAGLTGAAEMNADVLIRQELLFQRTGKSLGAFTDNADTLAVQSEVMRATFENLQATIGQELTPVITQFFSDLIPIIEEAGPSLVKIFEVVAEVLKELAGIFLDIFDPTTQLGESVAALAVQFEELGKTIFGKDFAFIGGVFDVARYFLDLFIRALTDLLYMIQSLIIEFQAWGTIIAAVFQQDWDTVAKGVQGISKELHAAKDAAIAAGNAMAAFAKAEAVGAKSPKLPDIWDIAKKQAFDAGNKSAEQYAKSLENGLKGKNTQKKTKDAVKGFFENLQEEIAKQNARTKLEQLGASEGLVNAVLGSGEDWKKVFNNLIKGGVEGIKKAQNLFNQTKAGLDEIYQEQEAAREASRKYAEALQEEAERAAEEQSKATQEEQQRLSEDFAKSQDALFKSFREANAPQEEIGRYTQSVRELTKGLNELIETNPFVEGKGGLFTDKARGDLIASVKNVGSVIEQVARQRDAIATRLSGAKSLMESVADQILGRFNITEIKGRATSLIKQLQRTVEQTRTFAAQVNQLRQAGLSEALLGQIVAAGAEVGGATAKSLLAGGQDAITEVNSLYGELGSIAQQMGEKTAIQMYGAGVDITKGLIEGLLAQQSQLEMTAERLASSFQSAFARASQKGQVTYKLARESTVWQSLTDPYMGSMEAAMAAAQGRFVEPRTPVNITINAGLGTDPVALGREVTNAIKRYESVSGKVFASA